MSKLTTLMQIIRFAIMKTFVTDISASTGRNDFIFDIWLWHGDLPGKGRHGTSHHAKAIYQIQNHFFQ
jgi:hypothetical protein